MSKTATKERFQIGDYWLSQQKRSKAWCRTWYDTKARQTKRSSLGTADFEEAKQKLTDWFVIAQTKSSEAPEEVLLAEVVARYWERHGQHLASAYRTKTALDYWLEFYGEITVSELTGVEQQEAFHVWLKDKGMKATTVARVITAGKAAINFAWKRGEIANVPYIIPIKKSEQEPSEPRGRPMEVEEIAALFEASDNPNFHLFLIFMIATAGRPDAIKDLTLDRLDVENRLIQLNPEGRRQTTKYRPKLRMPESIVPMVEKLKAEYPPETHVIGLGPEKMNHIRTSWRGARARAGLDKQVNPYSIRHTMARWLRKEGVSAWEVSAQLGHKRSDLSITEIYAPYDPTYLNEAVTAIDRMFCELQISVLSSPDHLLAS